MTTKNKVFDCVEMKNRIQNDIQADYETNKSSYSNIAEYIRASLRKSDWGKKQLDLFMKSKS